MKADVQQISSHERELARRLGSIFGSRRSPRPNVIASMRAMTSGSRSECSFVFQFAISWRES